VVERITFQNPENGFTEARLAPERRDGATVSSQNDERLDSLAGTLPDLQPGEVILAHGWWRNAPKHDWQFKASEACTALPATVRGMKRYFSSELVKGGGPRMGGGRSHAGAGVALRHRARRRRHRDCERWGQATVFAANVVELEAASEPDVLAKAQQPDDVAAACLFVLSLPLRAWVSELLLYPSAL
jgi:hypothetical protein